MTAQPFLEPEAVQALTGYRKASKQCQQLKAQGIAFFVNGRGAPVVPVSAIEGKAKPAPSTAWVSNKLA